LKRQKDNKFGVHDINQGKGEQILKWVSQLAIVRAHIDEELRAIGQKHDFAWKSCPR